MKNFTLSFLLIFISFWSFSQNQKYSRIKISLKENSLEKIARLGIPTEEGIVKKGAYFITELSQNDISKLSKNGFSYEILIDNMQKYYVDQNKNVDVKLHKGKNTNSRNIVTPNYFTLGSMGGFYTYSQILLQLDSMALRFPNLVKPKQQIGTTTTLEGRKLYYIKISDNPNVNENEPKIMFSALHHAREGAGMQQLFFFMYYLLENYNVDTTIRKLVDNTEFYFVPCVNPDGYSYNELTNPDGGGMWRKNRKQNNDGSFGIDLNRNYGYMWGYDNDGSSPNGSDDTFRGDSAFSENEIKIMRQFCIDNNFNIAINYHTYSNLLIYPWGYIASYLTPDSTLFKQYGKLLTKDNHYLAGTGNETVGYVTNGGSDDWMYGEQTLKNKIYSMTPEAGAPDDGFWPQINRIEDICKENITMDLNAARLTGSYSLASDISPKIIPQISGYFKYKIQRIGLSNNGNYKVIIIPLNNAFTSSNNEKIYTGLNLLQTIEDSIPYTLNINAGVSAGQKIKYLLTVNNDNNFINTDTIEKIYGIPTVAFSNDCNTLTGFTSNGWGLSNICHSAPKSITESPNGNYSGLANYIISMQATVNLVHKAYAMLDFWTKYEIEAGYDYAQVKISNDNGITWYPLAGKYTKPGSSNQIPGEPLYDGFQNNWVNEQIDLSNYLGQTVKFRFTFNSDAYSNFDGFYFDDLKVITIDSTTTNTNEINATSDYISNPIPNPSKESFSINYKLNNINSDCYLHITDICGKDLMIKQLNSNSDNTTINISNLSSGLYFYYIKNGNYKTDVKKLIKE